MAQSVGKKASNIAVWVILGLVIVGLMGFSAGSFGGGQQIIGRAGEKPISAQEYFNALQGEIRQAERILGRQVTIAEAQELGIQQGALRALVNQRALDNEATEKGLSVGDEAVREQLLAIPAFQSLTGQFDREQYRASLERINSTEERFEDGLREDAARELLQLGVVGGVAAPAGFAEALIAYAGESRDFTWARLDPEALEAPLPAPTDAQLQATYEADPAAYTLPETKRITYAALLPEMVSDEVDVAEDALRALYDERIAEFEQPERRLVERLIFPDEEAAEAAKVRIEREESTFDAEVEARGLTLAAVDLGDVSEAQLGEAGSAVFNAEAPAVVGPFPTGLGPALFRLNAILPARTTSFEAARPALREELAEDAARRAIDARVEEIENELAAGATLEEVVEMSDMELGGIDWFPGADAGLAAYETFSQVAAAVTEDDFPEIARLDDGGIFALRLDEIVEPRLQPLADVREDVTEAWLRDARTEALTERAEALAAEVEGGAALQDLGLTANVETEILRDGLLPDTPPGFLERVFEMAPGTVAVIPGAGDAYFVQLDTVNAADDSDPGVALLADSVRAQIAQSYAADLYDTFARGIVEGTDVSLDQAMINGIHANFQ
ncbi:MAG: SurA N-terminal domain-containing protein [Shimia sp.]